MSTRKIRRSSITGRFVGKGRVRRFPATTVTETVDVPSRDCSRRRRRTARHVTEENQNRRSFKAGKDVRISKVKNAGSNFKAGRDL
jgi:hypothetical protein